MNVAVIGPGSDTSVSDDDVAYRVGGLIALEGWTLVNGGMQGVMEAASRGAAEAGGVVVGLLPGCEADGANPWLTVAIPTGLSEARNAVLVRAASGVICVGGSWGTLSEIALAMRIGKAVVQIGGWHVLTGEGIAPQPQPTIVDSPEAAIRALKQATA